MRTPLRVSFKQYYDLVFRSRNALLGDNIYQVEFLDWIKAGIAFNTRGCELSTRKIAMFARLYNVLSRCVDEGDAPIREEVDIFSDAVIYFYEDILALYESHLESRKLEVRTKRVKTMPDFGKVLIIPAFTTVPWLGEVFTSKCESLQMYKCQNERGFKKFLSNPYLKQDTELWRSMAMMYDFGVKQVYRDVLLEVSLWDETM